MKSTEKPQFKSLPVYCLFLWLLLLSAVQSGMAATFNLTGVANVTTLRGVSPQAMDVAFTVSSQGSTLDWTASLDAAPTWARLSATAGSGAGSLQIQFTAAAASLAVGTYNSGVTILSGGQASRQTFSLVVVQPNIVKMTADYTRPAIYAINQDATNANGPSHIVFINTSTNAVEKVLPIGNYATDFDISYPEDRLYVTNYNNVTAGSIRAIDLSSRTVSRIITGVTDPWILSAGPAGRVMVEGLDQWIAINYLNVTGSTAVSLSANSGREGDGEFDPSGQFYYHAESNISNASIKRYRMDGTTFVPVGSSRELPYGSRNLLMSGDGSRIFWQSYAFNADLQDIGPLGVGELMYATSFAGEMTFSSAAAWSASGTNFGQKLGDLPVNTTAMAVSGDNQKLFYFNPTTRLIGQVPTSNFRVLAQPVAVPTPADGAVVAASQNVLSWTRAANAPLGYRVYFGTDSAAVGSATGASPQSLGTTTSTQIQAPGLAANTRYYWRLDGLQANGQVAQGPVWSFITSALDVDTTAVSLSLPLGIAPRTVSVVTSGPAGTAWTATSPTSWISVQTPNGNAGESIRFTLNATSLAEGIQVGTVNITSGGASITLPVRLDLFKMQLLGIVPDPSRPYAYGLSLRPAGPLNAPEGWVISMRTDTRQVVDALAVSPDVRDMALNPREDRLYIALATTNAIDVVDLATFTTLESIPISQRLLGLSAGRPGRLVGSGEGPFARGNIINAATGAFIGQNRLFYAGDHESTPNGKFLYQANTISSNSFVTKLDLSTDAFVEVASAPIVQNSLVDLVLSGNGQRVFVYDVGYDADLVTLRKYSQTIVASSYRGEMAFTASQAIDTSTGAVLAAVPQSLVRAVSHDQSVLVSSDLTNGRVVFTSLPNLSSGTSVPAPGMVTFPVNGGTVFAPLSSLIWDVVPQANRYRVYLSSEAVGGAGPAPEPVLVGTTEEASWKLPEGYVTGGNVYYWRVETETPTGNVLSSIRSFTASSFSLGTADVDLMTTVGAASINVSLPTTGLAGTNWTATSAFPWLTVTTASGSVGTSLNFRVAPGTVATRLFGSINVTANGASVSLPVHLSVQELQPKKLVTNPTRPFIHALQDAGTRERGGILNISANTGGVARGFFTTVQPSDIAVSPDGRYVYTISHTTHSISRVDLDTSVVEHRELPPITQPQFREQFAHYRMAVGPNDKVYWTDIAEAPKLHFFNFATGTAFAPPMLYKAPGLGFGRVALHSNGTHLVVTSQASWSAGNFNTSTTALLDVSGATPVLGPDLVATTTYPFDAPLIVRKDATNGFYQKQRFSPDFSSVSFTYPETVYAATQQRGFVLGSTGLFKETTGGRVWTPPDGASTNIVAVTNNDAAFVYFNPLTKLLVRFALSSFGEVPAPFPDDGETVSKNPAELTWRARTGATSYQVYFGTDITEVTNATGTTSTAFLGTTLTNSIALDKPFRPGGLWWWRVDTVTATGVTKGTVWRYGSELRHVATLGGAQVANHNADSPAAFLGNSMVLVGEPAHLVTNYYVGRIKVYRRIIGTDNWEHHQTLVAPAPLTTDLNTYFGKEIAVFGSRAWIAAQGVVYEAALSPATNLWSLTGRRVQPTETNGDFGASLAFNGTQLLVGHPDSGTNYYGSAVLYNVNNLSVARTMTQSSSTQRTFAGYGSSVAMGNGFAAVSYVNFSSSGIEVWVQSGTTWTRATTPLTVANVNLFGTSIAAGTNRLFVGAEWGQFTTGTPRSFIYTRSSTTANFALTAQPVNPGPLRLDGYTTEFANVGDAVVQQQANAAQSEQNQTWFSRMVGANLLPVTEVKLPNGYPYSTGSGVAVSSRYVAVTHPIGSNLSNAAVSIFLHDPNANLAPNFLPELPPFVEQGKAVSWALSATDDNPGDTVQFSSSNLPSWLSLTAAGPNQAILAGTAPAGIANYTITLTARDAAGDTTSVERSFSVVPSGSLPVISSTFTDATVDDYSPFTVTVGVAPQVAGDTYAWYLNGKVLEGKTTATLSLPHASAADAGSYRVRITRGQAWTESPSFTLTVNQVDDRYAGDWSMFGGSVSRSGNQHATFGRHRFLPAWTKVMPSGNQPITGEGRLYTAQSYSTSQPDVPATVQAWNLETGTLVWSQTIPNNRRVENPVYYGGRVYVSTNIFGGDSSVDDLRVFDAATGALLQTLNQVGIGVQNGGPAVDSSGIYLNGGANGSLQVYDLKGTLRYSLPSNYGWGVSLTLVGDYLFDGGLSFTTYNKHTGEFAGSGDFTEATIVADGNHATAVTRGNLLHPAVLPGMTSWKVNPLTDGSEPFHIPFHAPPALHKDKIYVYRDRTIQVRNANTGVLERTVELRTANGTPILGAFQPLVLDDVIIVPTTTDTHVLDLATGGLLQTLGGSGQAGYSNGFLFAADDANLRVWRLNQAAVASLPVGLQPTEDQPVRWEIPYSDADGDAVSFSTEGLPAWLQVSHDTPGRLVLTGTPRNDHNGPYTFTLTLNDGRSLPTPLSFAGEIVSVNDQPQATPPAEQVAQEDAAAFALPLQSVFRDEEDAFAALTLSIQTNSNSALFSSATLTEGQLRLTPALNAYGTATFTLRATDSGGLFVETPYVVSISPVNDAPTHTPSLGLNIAEDSIPPSIPLRPLLADVDNEVETLQLSILTPGNSQLLASQTISASGELQLVLLANAYGNTNVVVKATDAGGLSTDITIPITVTPVNDAPVAIQPEPFVGQEDMPIAPLPLQTVFRDVDNAFEQLSLSLVGNSNPALLSSITIMGDSLRAVPAPNAFGATTITLRATDREGLFVESAFLIQLAPVNDAPTSHPLVPVSALEDAVMPPIALRPFLFDVDDPVESLEIYFSGNSNPGLISQATLSPSGELMLTLTPNAYGTASISLQAIDFGGLTTDLVLPITIASVNDLPTVPATFHITTKEDTAVVIPLVGFDDLENGPSGLRFSIKQVENAALALEPVLLGGSLYVNPAADAYGVSTITLQVSDLDGGLNTHQVVVTVESVPDAPRLVNPAPLPTISATGGPISFALNGLFRNPDEGTLRFEIVSNSRPELFQAISIHPTSNELQATWAPHVWGTASVVVRAIGSVGLNATTSVELTLPAPTPPSFQLEGSAVVVRQTGLIRQNVIVTNTANREIGGFLLWVNATAPTVLYNGLMTQATAMPTAPGNYFVPWKEAIASGATRRVTLEFYAPNRVANFTVTAATVWDPLSPGFTHPAIAASTSTEVFQVTRLLPVAEGMLVEFTSVPGVSYQIQWSTDTTNWKNSPIPIKAGGTRTHWIDRGLPFTAAAGNRFYRVKRL